MRAPHVGEKKGRERRRAAVVSTVLRALLGLGWPKWKGRGGSGKKRRDGLLLVGPRGGAALGWALWQE
jgi:hypothetical protein